MIDVPSTGKGAKLVPRPSSRQVQVVLLLLRAIAGGPILQGASPFSARHVNLVQALVNGQQRGLQLVLCVLFGGRLAASELQAVVAAAAALEQLAVLAAGAVDLQVLRWLVTNQFHLRSLQRQSNAFREQEDSDD